MLLFGGINSSVSALSYSLWIPTPLLNSIQSTTLNKKTNTATPYVQPNAITIPTAYFLSPTRYSSTMATNIVTKSNTSRTNLSWNGGYGGIGGSYCLTAYPNVSGAYNAYLATGSWDK
ncbi:hypothetical protein ACYSNO_08025 [Enterococcus sp. LJL98]